MFNDLTKKNVLPVHLKNGISVLHQVVLWRVKLTKKQVRKMFVPEKRLCDFSDQDGW